MRTKAFAYGLAVAGALGVIGPAGAAVVTQTVRVQGTFTANTFSPQLTSADLQFTLTYDPAVFYAGPASGVAFVSATPAYLASVQVGFRYDPTYLNGTLTIGGTPNGVEIAVPGSNDFSVTINNTLASPALRNLDVTQASPPALAGTVMGTVTITPEPASAVVLAVAAALAGRRRR